MMKKYNKPEIVALALETVDVITNSGMMAATNALETQLSAAGVNSTGRLTEVQERFSEMQGQWSW